MTFKVVLLVVLLLWSLNNAKANANNKTVSCEGKQNFAILRDFDLRMSLPRGLFSTFINSYWTIPVHTLYYQLEQSWLEPLLLRQNGRYQVEICLSYARSIFLLFNWARFGSLIMHELTLAILLSTLARFTVLLKDSPSSSSFVLKCTSTFFSIWTFFIYYGAEADLLSVLHTALLLLKIWSDWRTTLYPSTAAVGGGDDTHLPTDAFALLPRLRYILSWKFVHVIGPLFYKRSVIHGAALLSSYKFPTFSCLLLSWNSHVHDVDIECAILQQLQDCFGFGAAAADNTQLGAFLPSSRPIFLLEQFFSFFAFGLSTKSIGILPQNHLILTGWTPYVLTMASATACFPLPHLSSASAFVSSALNLNTTIFSLLKVLVDGSYHMPKMLQQSMQKFQLYQCEFSKIKKEAAAPSPEKLPEEVPKLPKLSKKQPPIGGERRLEEASRSSSTTTRHDLIDSVGTASLLSVKSSLTLLLLLM
jgi:hypothetical protein